MERTWITNVWVAAILAWTPRMATAVLSGPADEARLQTISLTGKTWSGFSPSWRRNISEGISLIEKMGPQAPSFISKQAGALAAERRGAERRRISILSPRRSMTKVPNPNESRAADSYSAPAEVGVAPAAALPAKSALGETADAADSAEASRMMPAPAIASSLRKGNAFRSLNAELSELQQYDENAGAIDASLIQSDLIRVE